MTDHTGSRLLFSLQHINLPLTLSGSTHRNSREVFSRPTRERGRKLKA